MNLHKLINDENWFENLESYLFFITDSNVCVATENYINSFRSNLIAKDVTIEEGAIIKGLVKIESGCVIKSGTTIEGPVFIGEKSTLGPNCYVHHGVYIGSNSTVNQGAEIKGSILLNGVKCYHFGYIGNSIIGKNVNIGAGFISAVKRFDLKNVKSKISDKFVEIDKKVGCFIGNNSQIGVNVHTLPGRVIEPNSQVLPGSQYSGKSNLVSSNELDQEERVWEGIINIWDKEADRFWMRNNVFLTINGAILLFITSFSKDNLIAIIVSIFGMVLCGIWLDVNIIGKYYLDRWKTPLKQIEKQWHIKPLHIIEEKSRTDPIPNEYKSSSKYMTWLIKLFMFFWTFILLYKVIIYMMETIKIPFYQ